MEKITNQKARSADVVVQDAIAVISFLTAIDGSPIVAFSTDIAGRERLQSRIARAIAAQPKAPLRSK